MLYVSDERTADARMEQIMHSIQEKDKEEMKTLFSIKALDEAVDFNDGLTYLFELFPGKDISWERDKWCSSEKIRNGENSLQITSWYTIYTDDQEYKALIIDYAVDTINPDNAGLFTLRVVQVQEGVSPFDGYWQDMEIAGIYRPE